MAIHLTLYLPGQPFKGKLHTLSPTVQYIAAKGDIKGQLSLRKVASLPGPSHSARGSHSTIVAIVSGPHFGDLEAGSGEGGGGGGGNKHHPKP